MALTAVRADQLPEAQRAKLQPGEIPCHFGYIAAKGGCANPGQANQWILVTDKRILFEASVQEGSGTGARFIHQSGSIPMSKVSYVGTVTAQQPQGCSRTRTTQLRINSSGGSIDIAIPTQQEAERIQAVIDEILSFHG